MPVLVGAGVLTAAALAVLRRGRLRAALLGAALAALLVAPASWAVDTLGHPTNGTFPAGGPTGSARGPGGPGGAGSSRAGRFAGGPPAGPGGPSAGLGAPPGAAGLPGAGGPGGLPGGAAPSTTLVRV